MDDIPRMPGTLHAGWDFAVTEPGEAAEVLCRVCGEAMEASRGVVGPTGWAHAMAVAAGVMQGKPHDEFRCVHAGEPWHRQALALKMEAAGTASGRLGRMLLEEAEQVVRTRTATRKA
jgi:hypothetical protein